MKISIDEDTTKQALRMEGVSENRLDEALKYFTGSMMDHRYKALEEAARHIKNSDNGNYVDRIKGIPKEGSNK